MLISICVIYLIAICRLGHRYITIIKRLRKKFMTRFFFQWSLRSNLTPDSKDTCSCWREKETDDLMMMTMSSDSGITSPNSHHLDDHQSVSPCSISVIFPFMFHVFFSIALFFLSCFQLKIYRSLTHLSFIKPRFLLYSIANGSITNR